MVGNNIGNLQGNFMQYRNLFQNQNLGDGYWFLLANVVGGIISGHPEYTPDQVADHASTFLLTILGRVQTMVGNQSSSIQGAA